MRAGACGSLRVFRDCPCKFVVFVRTAPARFSIRQVETGVTAEGRTEIVRGVRDGEPVVSKGAFAVKSVLLSKELGEEK